jgi:hypothetical protein
MFGTSVFLFRDKLDSIFAVADDAEEDAGDQDGEDELWLCVMREL